jgi:glutamine amidotransferase
VAADQRAAGSSPRIAVVDYGAGNLVSVRQALALAGARVRMVSRPGQLEGADAIVVPGVGASAPAMATLRRRGLIGPICESIAAGRPYLGICLGLQLLFDRSEEDGALGFGVLPGTVRGLEQAPRLPHIGWNAVRRQRQHPLFEGINPDAPFYFVHSYAGEPTDRAAALGRTEHGAAFTSAVAVGSVLGVQFHPERSGDDGLRLLANFASLASG